MGAHAWVRQETDIIRITKFRKDDTVSKGRLFTSESVTEGHPDKICDAISDSVLDALLAEDPRSRVAVETMVTTGQVHVAGEITTSASASLGPVGTSTSVPSLPRMTAALSGRSKPRLVPTSLTTSRSQPLLASFARPWVLSLIHI